VEQQEDLSSKHVPMEALAGDQSCRTVLYITDIVASLMSESLVGRSGPLGGSLSKRLLDYYALKEL
jgi:hypothetical protein